MPQFSHYDELTSLDLICNVDPPHNVAGIPYGGVVPEPTPIGAQQPQTVEPVRYERPKKKRFWRKLVSFFIHEFSFFHDRESSDTYGKLFFVLDKTRQLRIPRLFI